MACSSDADCTDRGVCIDGKCECDLYIDGDYCEITYKDEIGSSKFAVWRFFFLSLFILLNIAVSYHLFVFWRTKKVLGLRGVTHIFLWLSSFMSVIYFATDPMGQTRNIPFLLEQLLFGFQIFCIFLAYLSLILFWVGAYHAAKKGMNVKQSWILSNTRPIFAIAAGIWFVLEIFERLIFGLHLKFKGRYTFDTAYNAYIGVMCFGLSATMTVYGTLIIKRFSRSPTAGGLNPIIKKVTIVSVVVSVTFIISVIIDLVVVIQKILYSHKTVLPSFSVVHSMFFILLAEMAYFMRPEPNGTSSSDEKLSSIDGDGDGNGKGNGKEKRNENGVDISSISMVPTNDDSDTPTTA